MKTIEPKTPKRNLLHGIRVGRPGQLSIAGLRQVARSDPEAFMRKAQGLIDGGRLRLRDIKDWRGLYAALADVEVPITVLDAGGSQRAILSSAFPVLVGNTVVADINDAYQQVPTIGEELVTEMDDDKAVTVLARLATLDNNVEQVIEGEDFPEITATEDTVEIGERPNGRLLRIGATAISRNDAPNIVAKVNKLGEIAARWVEEQTLKRVIDLYGSATVAAAPYSYRPAGTGTTLYNATANNPGTRAPSGTRLNDNALADETDLTNARTVLKAMRDDNNKPILIPPGEMILLVPDALLETAWKIKNTDTLVSTNTALVKSAWAETGVFGLYRILSSQYLDLWSSTAWYLGAFRQQFRRKWALRMEYVTLGQNTQMYLENRTAFQARIAWNCEVGAEDYVHVVQNLSNTSIPSA